MAPQLFLLPGIEIIFIIQLCNAVLGAFFGSFLDFNRRQIIMIQKPGKSTELAESNRSALFEKFLLPRDAEICLPFSSRISKSGV